MDLPEGAESVKRDTPEKKNDYADHSTEHEDTSQSTNDVSCNDSQVTNLQHKDLGLTVDKSDVVTITLRIDVLESILESKADDLMKVFKNEHNKDEESLERCINKELENLKCTLLSFIPDRKDESTKQPNQSNDQLVQETSSTNMPSNVKLNSDEPSAVTNDDQVTKQSSEHIQHNEGHSQIGTKRPNDFVDVNETPTKVPRISTPTNTSCSSTKSVKKGKIDTRRHLFVKSAPDYHMLSSNSAHLDKKPTLSNERPIPTKQSRHEPQHTPTSVTPRRLRQSTLDLTSPKKPREYAKSQQSLKKRQLSRSSKIKSPTPKRSRRSRCSEKEKHLCTICSKPDCGECKNCRNKGTYHKACLRKPIEECCKNATGLQPRSYFVKKPSQQQLSGTNSKTNSSLRDDHSSKGVTAQQTQPSQQTPSSSIQSQPLSGTNSEIYSNSRDIGSRSSEDLATQQTPPSQQAPSSSRPRLANSEMYSSSKDSHCSEVINNTTQHVQTPPSQQAPSSSRPRLANSEMYSSSKDSHCSEVINNTTQHVQTQPSQQAPCSSIQGLQQLSEAHTGVFCNSEINPSSGGNVFSEDASQQTQPSPKTPSSTIQSQPLSGTNSETYSNSRDIGSRSFEDLATHQTPPSQQAPSSSVQGQQQLPEIDTRSVNNSEINSSSGSNNFSESLTTQETQRASQSINIVQSQLQTEVGEELPSTAGTLQNSNPGSQEDFHSQLDKALKDVHVKILTAKCGVFGPPETGKSNFKALVCGKNRQMVRRSTAIAEDAVQITNYTEELVEMHRTRDRSNVRWFVTDNKKIAMLVANTMYDHKNPIKLTVDEKRRMTKTREKLLENMTKLVKRNLTRNPKGLKGMRLIYLVDTGGQPQFQEILPMFVRSSSVHFLVHRLNESLDDCPQFDYQVDGVKYSVPEENLVSNKVYLQQSLRTISSCNFSSSVGSTPKPHVAVIGMFKDKCDDHLIDAKQKAVTECIAPFTELKTNEEKKSFKKNETNKKNKCVVITPTRHTEKPIFAIDGSEEGWTTNGKMIDKIHIAIENVTDDLDAEIPLRWFLFLNLLKEGCETKRFLDLEACYKLAKDEDISMDEDDVNEALELFDELNLVLHFRKFLPNVVFVSTRFLLDKVTKILVQSFNCSSDKADITPQERLQFRKTGIIDKSTIKRVKAIEEGFNDVFKFDDLFEILENLCIFAKVSHTCNRYFVPCVLALEQDGKKSDFLEKISEEMHSNVVEPLVISFSDGYSPRGLFCASISYLTKYWKIESESSTLVRQRNLIEFNYLREKEAVPLGSVVIVDHTTRFEVYSTCNPEYLREIRRTIYEALWYVATKCLDYSPENIDISFGFTCDINCGITYRHGTHTSLEDKDDPQWTTKCIKNKKSKHGKPLNDKQRPWFYSKKSDVASTTVSDKELTVKLLLDEVASKTNQWQTIAFQLDFQPVQIERIEIQENRDIAMCFQKMFTKWQRIGKPQFTWEVIIDALKSPSVEESQLADELSRKYLS